MSDSFLTSTVPISKIIRSTVKCADLIFVDLKMQLRKPSKIHGWNHYGAIDLEKNHIQILPYADANVELWYESFSFHVDNFITKFEVKGEKPFHDIGKIISRNMEMFLSTNEMLESTFLIFQRNFVITIVFLLVRPVIVHLSNG